ncbi:DUF4328 domain-containing protein [Nonomuraea glycinis]|nr:DUF4328 domain-containing protein [Nonomuraea glycinis]MCA2175219.1 DUF4328 domain-containing protein [Nonomuraea glycinis]
MAALAVYSVAAVAVVVSDLQQAALIDRILVDPTVTDAEINLSDALATVFAVAELATTLLAMVAFMVWLYRVRANAEIITPAEHRRARIWLVAGWIVPIVSWWFPKQIIDDIWTASHRRGLEPSPRAGLVTTWWAAWLMGSWTSYVAGRLFLRADEPEAMAAAARFDVVCIALMLVAAGLAAMVIHKISKVQEARRLEPVHPQAGDGWPAGAVQQQPGDGWASGGAQQAGDGWAQQRAGDDWASGGVQRTGEG